MSWTKYVLGFHPQLWNSGEAHHIVNEPCHEEEDLFHRWKKQQAICPKGTYSYRKGYFIMSLTSLALMHGASSPRSEVMVGTIPTTSQGIPIQSQVDCI